MLIDRGKISLDDISTRFLDKDFIERHESMWVSMSKKYEFLDRNVDFEESVYITKDIIDRQIKGMEKAKTLKIRLR